MAEARLREREEARKAAVERRKLEKDKEIIAEETQDHFMSHFTHQKDTIESALGTLTKENAKETLEDIAVKMNLLKKYLSDSAGFLAPYTMQSSQQKVSKLQEMINEKQSELAPRQKFAFKSRTKKPDPPNKKLDMDTGPLVIAAEGTTLAGHSTNTIEIKDKTNENITLEADVVNGCDVSLTNLSWTIVRIRGSPGTLHITNSNNCKILTGPVQRSVFIDDSHKCSYVIACQQDCNELRFAPYNWDYPQLSDHFNISGLNCDVNNWDKVDDFNWLTGKERSPNWSILPDPERQQAWEGGGGGDSIDHLP